LSQAAQVGGVQIRIPEGGATRARQLGILIAREPFQRRAWAELAFFLTSTALVWVAAFLLAAIGAAGLALTVVFVGILILAGALRAARGFGRWQRGLSGVILQEEIPEPKPFTPRPGFFGWLRAALGDPAAWRAMLYFFARIPLSIFEIWFAFSIWFEALLSLLSPVYGGAPRGFGVLNNLLGHPYSGPGGPGVNHLRVFVTGVVLLFIAPWPMRLVVSFERWLMVLLLGPDAATSRVRRLEESRARTVDNATATLRRIERDLHDGTQAQLVALAMRLGLAKEKLDSLAVSGAATGRPIEADLEAIRRLVGDAHRGAKEAITDLRDLARGIHPPALDTGLENALATLTARSPVPTAVSVQIQTRPTPAIEAITYFCAAELLANVAQHAEASQASVSCAQHGPWLRLVVRDDGHGGAAINGKGSSSSGLAGLSDRVSAVDGYLSVASPPGGPTIVTVDIPTTQSS
jgi:signal transduction histidine kinase